jgi:hypothetical protein
MMLNPSASVPSTLTTLAVQSNALNSLSIPTVSSIIPLGYTPPKNWSSWDSGKHSSKAQKLGLEIGLSVGAVIGVILMLLIHISYRCWKHRQNTPRLAPYGMKVEDPTQGRISWIATWKKRLSKQSPATTPPSESASSENKCTELPADDVSMVPGRIELPHENTQSTVTGHQSQDAT